MNLTRDEARSYLRRLRARLDDGGDRLVFVLPPFTALDVAREELAGSPILYGAQNVHHEDSGAHTGEVSAPMLAELGCRIVEVGHSERRRDQCEDDPLIARKVDAVLRDGMWPLLCVGESGPQRDAGMAEDVVLGQLATILGPVPAANLGRVLVAYEPWWAIGEGAEAAPLEHVARVHATIRVWLARRRPQGVDVPILYGGSVDLANAPALLATAEVDGLFVGRAALDPDVFARIVMTGPAAPDPHGARDTVPSGRM